MADQDNVSTHTSVDVEYVDYLAGKVICGATTKAGNPCKNYAVWGTQPPRCPSHGGRMGSYVTVEGGTMMSEDQPRIGMASHYSFDAGGWRVKEIDQKNEVVYMERIPNWDEWLATDQGQQAMREELIFAPGKVFRGGGVDLWSVELIAPGLPEGAILTGIPVYVG